MAFCDVEDDGGGLPVRAMGGLLVMPLSALWIVHSLIEGREGCFGDG